MLQWADGVGTALMIDHIFWMSVNIEGVRHQFAFVSGMALESPESVDRVGFCLFANPPTRSIVVPLSPDRRIEQMSISPFFYCCSEGGRSVSSVDYLKAMPRETLPEVPAEYCGEELLRTYNIALEDAQVRATVHRAEAAAAELARQYGATAVSRMRKGQLAEACIALGMAHLPPERVAGMSAVQLKGALKLAYKAKAAMDAACNAEGVGVIAQDHRTEVALDEHGECESAGYKRRKR
jgi:hypothetical protein